MKATTQFRRRSSRRAAAVMFAFALGLAGSGCREEQAAGQTTQKAPITVPLVEFVEVREGALPLTEQVSGTLRARNQVAIHAEIEARIVEVLVRDGETVQRGQPLVRLEPVSVRSQLQQAKASVELSEAATSAAQARVAELEAQIVRTRRLADQKLVSPLELETQEAQYAAAKAAAREAQAGVDHAKAMVTERRNSVDKTVVRSPVDGKVGRRNAEVGMLADPATILFMVGDIEQIIVEVPLNEKMLAHVEEGQPVEIRSSVLGDEVRTATLSRISPFVTPGSFSTTAEIDLDNEGGRLKPGMFVTVDILYGKSRRAALVPLSSLWEEPTTGNLVVYVVEFQDGMISENDLRKVEKRSVDLIAHGRDRAGIDGVRPGEHIVTVGQFLLDERNDAKARVRPTSWEAVLELQRRQPEDLLHDFLDKQQRLARTRGAKPPTVDEAIEEARSEQPPNVAKP